MGDTRHDQPNAPTTQLVIPYWSTDDGTIRPLDGSVTPLPAPVVLWACPSIQVTSGPFVPGQPVTVRVTAANYGSGSLAALATIQMYWASASAGLSIVHPFGTQQAVPVPSHGGTGTSDPITDTIPDSAGPHCCLFASVAYLNDKPTSAALPDPLTDRHWAQLNLFAVVLAMDGTFNFQFWAGNPLPHGTRFELVARQVQGTTLEALSAQIGRRPKTLDNIDLALNAFDLAQPREASKTKTKAEAKAESKSESKSEAKSRAKGQTKAHTEDQGHDSGPEIELRPRERKAVSIDGRVTETLEADEFVAIEIEQRATTESGAQQVIGMLGLVLIKRA